MSFVVNGNTYHFEVASDIIRDGLGIEVYLSDGREILAGIFRNDHLKKIQFSSFKLDIHLEVIEELMRRFELSVGRNFQDDLPDF